MFIFIRLSFFIAEFLTSFPFSVLCLNTGVVHKITIFKTGTRFVRSCSGETRVVGRKGGKSSVACMASTISTAHRSQHFKPVADGVENSLRRRGEWKVNEEISTYSVQSTSPSWKRSAVFRSVEVRNIKLFNRSKQSLDSTRVGVEKVLLSRVLKFDSTKVKEQKIEGCKDDF